MPITNTSQVKRMRHERRAAAGLLADRLDATDDPAEVRRSVWDVASNRACQPLEAGARASTSDAGCRGHARKPRQPNWVSAQRYWTSMPPASISCASMRRCLGDLESANMSQGPVPARPRRHARARRHRGAGLPREQRVVDGRLPRRRGLLRHQRLPHHAAAHGRARAHRNGRSRSSSGFAAPVVCCRRCS